MKATSARILNLSRRNFIVGTAAAAGSLAIGIRLPSGFGSAEAQSVANAGTTKCAGAAGGKAAINTIAPASRAATVRPRKSDAEWRTKRHVTRAKPAGSSA